jgi:2-polyprenyl-6-methoxyphenol hydroxylase-like FAD-dependent oxidoreductase
VRFCATAAGVEIARLTHVLGLDLDGSDLAAEAAQQVSQPLVEEVLRDLAAQHPLVTTRFGSRAEAVEVSDDGARVTVVGPGGGTEVAEVLSAPFVVGADGSRSVVRRAIGAQYVGAAGGRPNVNITFRSRELAGLVPPAIHHWVLSPQAPGVVGPLDLDGVWWAIATGVESIADDAEAAALVRGLIGADVDVEILATDPWQARLLLSDSYRKGAGFLVGDAAHQNPPWGGHGFNTGVGDAMNLAWKLAAVLHGWAPPELLDSYEAERRPVAQQTIDLSATNMRALSIDLSSEALMQPGPDGDAARAAAAADIAVVKRAEFYSLGLVLGYGYGPDAAAQAPTTDVYLPSARPGNRLPHSRNGAGESLFDVLGEELTLLAGTGAAGASSDDWGGEWVTEAARREIPLAIVDPVALGFPPVAGEDAVLVRPDEHIAWVGDPVGGAGPALDAAVWGFGTPARPTSGGSRGSGSEPVRSTDL